MLVGGAGDGVAGGFVDVAGAACGAGGGTGVDVVPAAGVEGGFGWAAAGAAFGW